MIFHDVSYCKDKEHDKLTRMQLSLKLKNKKRLELLSKKYFTSQSNIVNLLIEQIKEQ